MAVLSWWLSKLLVKSDYAGMVNIIAEKKIMPEYIQNQANSESITKEAFTIINSSDRQTKMKLALLSVKKKLQGAGASQRAAEQILSLVQTK